MGCDMHLHQEVMIDDKWHHYSHPVVGRCYQLFAKMAGVRNSFGYVPIVPIRGLPEDATFLTTRDYATRWAKDAHHVTWMNWEEVTRLEDFCVTMFKQCLAPQALYWFAPFGYLDGNSWAKCSSTQPDIQDVRFIFWFDN